MSKARDIANILSGSNSLATDTEVTTAVSTHATAANGHIGRGITANRPASPSIGDTYFDTTLAALISYKSGGWEKVSQDPAPQIANISPTTAGTTGTTITITGSSFKSGLAVKFIGADATEYISPVATFVGGTTVTATTPALSVANEPYDVKVINNDNQFAILENALDAGGSPTWSTASGTIATITEQTALNVSVSATDPDGTSIVYSSSNLPAGTPTPVSFAVTNSGSGAYNIDGVSNGAITLTRGGTYTFNVNASGHPFYIQTTGNGYNSYNVYSSGVTGAGAQVGTVTFVVPSNAPSILYYQCQFHSSMYGQINIIDASPWITLNSSTGALTGTAPDVSSNTTYSFNVTASDGVNTSSRAFNVVSNYLQPLTVDYLVVAGGGGGGGELGGGGGAGGMRCTVDATGGSGSIESALALTRGTSYALAVGDGGAGGVANVNGGIGGNGINSVFSTITSTGGGAGARGVSSTNGGSGGGSGQAQIAGSGLSNQGFGGGTSPEGPSAYGAGGGGGAGGIGQNGTSTYGGTGGIGRATSISGTSTYYAGGGGGGVYTNSQDNPEGLGGLGGGGKAANTTYLVDAAGFAGTPNTGGGGGGAVRGTNSLGSYLNGGAGGSGVIVLKYPSAYTATISGGLTSSTSTAVAGYKITTFTSGSGTVTF